MCKLRPNDARTITCDTGYLGTTAVPGPGVMATGLSGEYSWTGLSGEYGEPGSARIEAAALPAECVE